MCEQAGNSMHLFAMTALQLHTMIQYKYTHVPSLISNLAFAAKSMRRRQEHERQHVPRKRLRLRTKGPAPEYTS